MKIVHQFDWNNETNIYKTLREEDANPNTLGGFDFQVEDTEGRIYKGSARFMSTLDRMSRWAYWSLVKKTSKKGKDFHDPEEAFPKKAKK